MIGAGTLFECLADARVESVLAIVRTSTGVRHPKVREVLHADFFNCASIQSRFADRDACLFCLGVSSVGIQEPDYHRLTYELTMAAARRRPGIRRSTTCWAFSIRCCRA